MPNYNRTAAKKLKEKKKVDLVNRPPHYQTKAGIESIDVIEAFELDFKLGNVVKYILRSGKKSKKTRLIDLKKAQWFLNRCIDNG